MALFEYWKTTHTAPCHFPVTEEIWKQSIDEDVDSDGRKLSDQMVTKLIPGGMIQCGKTAFEYGHPPVRHRHRAG